MAKKTRLDITLENEELKSQVREAAAKHGKSMSSYCVEAVVEKLARDNKLVDKGKLNAEEIERRKAILARIDKRREEIGPIGTSVTELIKEGRKR